MASALASQVEEAGPDLQAVAARFGKEMAAKGLVSLRLTAPDGRESVRLGEPGRLLFPIGVTLPLTSRGAPLAELRVEADDRPLLRQAARVFGIHLLVAVLLAAVVYRIPMRALRLAIDEVEGTYARLVHAEKLGAIGEMYASLAHEINNPLGIILTRVRLMLRVARERELSPELLRDLEVIDRHGNRIAEIVRDLLIFARRGTFELIETDLNEVITNIVPLVQTPFAKQDIRVECRLDPSLPPVRMSPDQMQQVFLNLLTNARDAMPRGGTITLRTSRDGRHVVAEVRDTGMGIAPEIQGRIFEPFFTTKEVGKGTGLGLSVSYGIVRAHGGDMEVESSPGKGTLFRVTLPIRGGPA